MKMRLVWSLSSTAEAVPPGHLWSASVLVNLKGQLSLHLWGNWVDFSVEKSCSGQCFFSSFGQGNGHGNSSRQCHGYGQTQAIHGDRCIRSKVKIHSSARHQSLAVLFEFSESQLLRWASCEFTLFLAPAVSGLLESDSGWANIGSHCIAQQG